MSGFLGGGIGPVALKRRQAGNGLLNNLIAYWPLNEAGGANNALDLHSNALHLTQNSSPGAGTGKVYATARTFDGSADYFSRASEALLQTGDVDFTIAVWVYLTGKGNARGIVGKYDNVSNQRAYQIDYDNTVDRFRFVLSANGTTATVLSANQYGSPGLNTWTFLCAWYDASADTMYLSVYNGTADSAAHVGGAFGSSSAQFAIGYVSYGAMYFHGRIGPVAMWKSPPGGGGVLTAAQRTALYNGGAGLAYADFTV